MRRIRQPHGDPRLMIQDLFETARILCGKLEIAKQPVDPLEIVNAAVEIAESLPGTPPIVVESSATGPCCGRREAAQQCRASIF